MTFAKTACLQHNRETNFGLLDIRGRFVCESASHIRNGQMPIPLRSLTLTTQRNQRLGFDGVSTNTDKLVATWTACTILLAYGFG